MTELACADLPDAPCILAASDLLRAAVTRSAGWTDEELDAAQSRLAGVILDEIRELPHEALGLPMPREVRLVKIARALSEQPAEDRRLEEWAAWGRRRPAHTDAPLRSRDGFQLHRVAATAASFAGAGMAGSRQTGDYYCPGLGLR